MIRATSTPVGPAYTADDTATLLGISRLLLKRKSATSEVLHVWDIETGEPAYPVWQFTDAGLKPAIAPVMSLFAGCSRWDTARWWTTVCDVLGTTPIDYLDRGTSPVRLHTLAAEVAYQWRSREGAGERVHLLWDHGDLRGIYTNADHARTDLYRLHADAEAEDGAPVDRASYEITASSVRDQSHFARQA